MYGDQCGEFVCESCGLNGYKGVIFPRRGYTLLCTDGGSLTQTGKDRQFLFSGKYFIQFQLSMLSFFCICCAHLFN